MVDFRITEGSDSRITEGLDSRILEDGTSASFIVGTSSVTFQGFVTRKGVSNLQGNGSLESTADIIPFSSSVYAKVNGSWVSVIPYVKSNNIWSTPVYIGINNGTSWKRVY